MDFTVVLPCPGWVTKLSPCPGRGKVSTLSLCSASFGKLMSEGDLNASDSFAQLETRCAGFRMERGVARGMFKYTQPDRNTL